MKIAKNKTVATTIALFLALTIAVTLVALPAANAHSPAWQIPTYSFIVVAPNPVGVGQKLSVTFWLNSPPPTANVMYGDRFENLTVKVTKPDGSTEILGPFVTDDVGGSFTDYTPNAAGNYTFQMFFPGQVLAGANPAPGSPNPYIGDYFEPCESRVVSVTVQE
jgi:hypothetical protein